MPQETEIKLALHPADAGRLLAHPLLQALPRVGQRLHNTYFDTPQRPASEPFSADGGLRLLTGNLGRCVIKVSAARPC